MRKGDNAMERPWRRAELLFLASKRVRVSEEKLRAVAARADEPATLPTSTVAPRSPDEHEPVQASRFRRLDVPKYLSHFGLGFTEVPGKDNKGRMRLALERCPFHPDHGGRDCVVFQGGGRPAWLQVLSQPFRRQELEGPSQPHRPASAAALRRGC